MAPPGTAEIFFALLVDHPLLGLLSLDLLYLVNNAVIIVIYLALFVSLKHNDDSWSLIALVFGLVGIAAYFASNTAFEILALSRQYAGAGDAAQRTALFVAAQAVLAIYKGTAFNSYFILNAASLLVFASVMLQRDSLPLRTGWIGLSSGILMLIPSTVGTIGLIFPLASLVPWAVFLALISRKFFQFAE